MPIRSSFLAHVSGVIAVGTVFIAVLPEHVAALPIGPGNTGDDWKRDCAASNGSIYGCCKKKFDDCTIGLKQGEPAYGQCQGAWKTCVSTRVNPTAGVTAILSSGLSSGLFRASANTKSADTPPPPSNGQEQQSFTPDMKKVEVKREGRRGSYPLHYGWNHEYCTYSEWEDYDHKYHKLAFINRDGNLFWAEWPYEYNDYHDVALIYEACHNSKYGYDIWVDDPTGKLHWSKIRIRHEP